ncbi:bifunctional glycosyltransferase family 2 protein/CDP-glycerol:glycerophosphate glycerophosphotransferase [Actinoplanes oblitus]|uniref:Bifunctional glycosyltransferase family 2 protein/CDP-glycerol:glycerophosphate glycerophosphotransferase n=1 Tax=Actinoplanes oblitus TaxID=3040509 RepID=A0ABY8WDI9_9ACTN|nr:bifunctional glycosyltransferase family 2 protein/CDP-glycerol:glycerophosphate glycerophosphotransferase [Actinoplanes oblitus]WIM95936.1 bifunctional glycosyltransferase family 2 protein/CDP-glycerol:glycerophosphate glycerophosphotransferase [Actinoplanes oblitus]
MSVALTVVTTAWRVQGYLTECLDSLLCHQHGAALELVAVDDASPDHCGALLDERAAGEPRLVVVHRASTGGPGEARNTGLDRATGDYVWFVDGDDRVVPGALPVIAERLAAEKPDLLVVGVARELWNRTVRRWTAPAGVPVGPAALAAPPVPLGGLIVRRQFLLDAGIRFRPGRYEDVAFAYQVLAAATTAGTVEHACYVFRPDRPGALRGTPSPAHADAVTQYEHVLALPGAGPRTLVRAVDDLLGVLGRGMVPPGDRRALFGRIAALLRRHRVGPLDGVRLRLLAWDAYRTYRLWRALHALPGRLRGPLGRGRRTLRKALLRLYYQAQLRRPIDENLAVYAAYWYRGYACNPAAVYEKAAELVPRVRGVWVVRRGGREVPDGVPVVRPGTRAYYRALARAKYLINNATFPPYVVKRRGQVHVQTHHGTPLKTMGLDQPRFPASLGGFDIERMRRNIAKWDFSVTANRHTTLLWDRQFPISGETLETGYPRNDRLALATAEDTAAARAELGLAPHERVVLYAPTHREWHPVFTPVLDVDELAEALGPDTRVLLRGHYFYDSLGFPPRHPRVLDVSRHPSIERLSLASDVMITDFSSVMFDYAVLDRPLVIFAPDWEVYRAVRGVSFDLATEHAGTFATSFAELVEAFRGGQVTSAGAAAMRARFRERFCSLEDGHASERVVRRVFGG